MRLNDIIMAHLQSPECITLQKNYPGITLETHLAPGLLNISGSPVHLDKAVMNLLINSFEAIEGKGTIVVETENREVAAPLQGYDTTLPGKYVVLTISDNGMGIARENLNRIFEPFYSSKVLGRSGTGLGMTVVWGTVKDHGGSLDVQSSPGNGTAISVFLPVAEEDAPQQVQTGPRAVERGKGETILLVDDVPEQRLLGNSILAALGYKIEMVSSGEEAVNFLSGRPVDLILLDMIMEPGMDGLDTYRSILKIHPDQKVIIVSGSSTTQRMQKALELGVRCCIKKPYTLEEIASKIHRELTG